uniref:Uncharacterized protein n=1 Tax=Anguilla anguilla TaxID=7936 RepID=A0A0E9X1T1_ANGAN
MLCHSLFNGVICVLVKFLSWISEKNIFLRNFVLKCVPKKHKKVKCKTINLNVTKSDFKNVNKMSRRLCMLI